MSADVSPKLNLAALERYCLEQSKRLKDAGFVILDHTIASPQKSKVEVDGIKDSINFTSNDYNALASAPMMIECAKKTLEERGYGMASAPLMCGQQDIHRLLEKELAEFHGTDKAVLYPSGYQANLGFFATMFGPDDVIISDQFNHASIIDGIKLCKASKRVFKHMNYKHLEKILKETQDFGKRCVVTEGVFSMDADIIDLKTVVKLCKKYNAVLFLDDCHGVGIIGKTGRGTPEHCGVPMSDIDAYIATMGKGLSGGGGGYITGSHGVITWLKQRSRTYIFSNAICPPIINCARLAIKYLSENPQLFVKR